MKPEIPVPDAFESGESHHAAAEKSVLLADSVIPTRFRKAFLHDANSADAEILTIT